jgi:hypothetical protein
MPRRRRFAAHVDARRPEMLAHFRANRFVRREIPGANTKYFRVSCEPAPARASDAPTGAKHACVRPIDADARNKSTEKKHFPSLDIAGDARIDARRRVGRGSRHPASDRSARATTRNNLPQGVDTGKNRD